MWWCKASLCVPCPHSPQCSPAQQPGAESLAERKVERPSLLPAFTNRPLWGCQASGQEPGCRTADFCLVLMLADSPGQPCEHHPTRYLGADPADRDAFELGAGLPWGCQCRASMATLPSPSCSAQPLPEGLFPRVLWVGPRFGGVGPPGNLPDPRDPQIPGFARDAITRSGFELDFQNSVPSPATPCVSYSPCASVSSSAK